MEGVRAWGADNLAAAAVQLLHADWASEGRGHGALMAVRGPDARCPPPTVSATKKNKDATKVSGRAAFMDAQSQIKMTFEL